MKSIILFFIFINVGLSQTIDKDLAEQMSTLTEEYSETIKDENPDKVVVFMSSRIDPTFMHIQELDILDIDLENEEVLIERASGAFTQVITNCSGEKGNVDILNNQLRVNTDSFPFRLICYGDGDNYREAYTTFKTSD